MSFYPTRIWLKIKIVRRFDCASSKLAFYADGTAEARTKGYFSESTTEYQDYITNRPGDMAERVRNEIDQSLIGNVSVEVSRVSFGEVLEFRKTCCVMDKMLETMEVVRS